MTPAAQTLIHTALERGALKLGEFTLKSGRPSPYFFNFGALDNGAALMQAAEAYADLLIDTVGDYAVVMKVGAGVPTVNFRTD